MRCAVEPKTVLAFLAEFAVAQPPQLVGFAVPTSDGKQHQAGIGADVWQRVERHM